MIGFRSGVYRRKEVDFAKFFDNVLSGGVPEDVGAVCTFLGITKKAGIDGREVSLLEMDSYVEHANPAIEKICREVEEKFDVRFVVICHLIGEFKVGDPIVLVAVGGRSREEVFQATREAVERYKKEPALFKKEVYVDGTATWVSHA